MMSECSNTECSLESYSEFEECILHCSKKEIDFFKIRSDFYNALENYVADNKSDSSGFCHFFGIEFPKPDIQSTINYIKILKPLKQIHFDNCHFHTSYLDLTSPEFFFQECYFHDYWTLYNYKILKNIDDVIYQSCEFSKKVSTYTPEDTDTWLYKYNNSQFDYSCIFKSDVEFYRSSFLSPPFNANQDNHKKNTLNKLTIEKCELKDFEIYFKNQENAEIEFKNSIIKSKLKIRSEEYGSYEEQQRNKAKLKKLKIIDCHADDGAYLRIGYLDIDEFILSIKRGQVAFFIILSTIESIRLAR